MQFSTMQTEVFQQTGLDSTNVTNQTNVQRWINMAQQDIVGRWPWTFLRGEEFITTVPDYTTGTVSVNSGGTSVTGVGTTFASGVGDGTYKIQFAGALDWYTVSTYNSATSLTILTPYAQTTNASGVTYTLRRMLYPLSSNADRIIDCKNNNTPIKMFETDMRTLDSVSPDLEAVNNSYGYVAWSTGAFGTTYAGQILIQPYPFPSDTRLFWVKTLLRVADLVNPTDISIIPVKWHHILTFGANALAFTFMNKMDIAGFWVKTYEQKIEDMMLQGKLSEDDAPVLKSVDSVARGVFIQMPGNYPIVGSR